jgi:hypothetical protein
MPGDYREKSSTVEEGHSLRVNPHRMGQSDGRVGKGKFGLGRRARERNNKRKPRGIMDAVISHTILRK